MRSSVSKNGQKAQVLVVTDGKSNDNVYAFSNRCVYVRNALSDPYRNALVGGICCMHLKLACVHMHNCTGT